MLKSINLIIKGAGGMYYSCRFSDDYRSGEYQLREPAALYNTHFDAEKDDIDVENTYLLDV